MSIPSDVATTIILSIFGSTGFWALVQRQMDKKSASREMILGLGYDRLMHQCHKYIERGYITVDEFEDLTKYLYNPYINLGGNGTAKALYDKVKCLPNKEES